MQLAPAFGRGVQPEMRRIEVLFSVLKLFSVIISNIACGLALGRKRYADMLKRGGRPTRTDSGNQEVSRFIGICSCRLPSTAPRRCHSRQVSGEYGSGEL